MNDTGNGSWTVFVGACAVAVAFLGQLITAVWTLGRSGNATDEKIAEKDRAVTDDLIALERRLEERILEAGKDFGETVGALKAKVTDTELWNRDNFVSKTTFKLIIDENRRSWERFEDRLNERLDRLEKKIDKSNDNPH